VAAIAMVSSLSSDTTPQESEIHLAAPGNESSLQRVNRGRKIHLDANIPLAFETFPFTRISAEPEFYPMLRANPLSEIKPGIFTHNPRWSLWHTWPPVFHSEAESEKRPCKIQDAWSLACPDGGNVELTSHTIHGVLHGGILLTDITTPLRMVVTAPAEAEAWIYGKKGVELRFHSEGQTVAYSCAADVLCRTFPLRGHPIHSVTFVPQDSPVFFQWVGGTGP
jgi:hypothetical protein